MTRQILEDRKRREQQASASPGPSQTSSAGQERVVRAKSGIISALKEIQTSLPKVTSIAVSTNPAEIMPKVKILKAMKAELQKASEVVSLKTHQYSAPPMTGDRLQAIRAHLDQEAQMIVNILADIEAGVPGIEQATQLVVLVKLCKTVLGLVKA